MSNTKPNSSWLKTLSIGFSIISFGITLAIIGYIVLTTKQNQPANQQPTTASPTIVQSSPTTDEANNWKAYTSKELKVTFKYPANFRVSEGYGKGRGLAEYGILVDFNQTEGYPPRRMDITNSEKHDFWSLSRSETVYNLEIGKTWKAPNNAPIEITRIRNETINGIGWHVYEDNVGYELPAPLRYLVTNHKGKYYIIRITYSNPENVPTDYPWYGADFLTIYDQILSTFQFSN